jgi:hypothetical protein
MQTTLHHIINGLSFFLQYERNHIMLYPRHATKKGKNQYSSLHDGKKININFVDVGLVGRLALHFSTNFQHQLLVSSFPEIQVDSETGVKFWSIFEDL